MKNLDGVLNIQTTDIIHFDRASAVYDDYFESEPTDYRDLLALKEKFEPSHADPHLVDFGCGTGRAIFFMNHFFHIPTTGVEVNDLTYRLCEKNLVHYRTAHPDHPPVQIFQQAAEAFKILPDHNVFYFFNPFSQRIFRKIMKKLAASYEAHPRAIDLILYYPLDEIVDTVEIFTPFTRAQSIDLAWHGSKYDRFDIFRSKSGL